MTLTYKGKNKKKFNLTTPIEFVIPKTKDGVKYEKLVMGFVKSIFMQSDSIKIEVIPVAINEEIIYDERKIEKHSSSFRGNDLHGELLVLDVEDIQKVRYQNRITDKMSTVLSGIGATSLLFSLLTVPFRDSEDNSQTISPKFTKIIFFVGVGSLLSAKLIKPKTYYINYCISCKRKPKIYKLALSNE